mmetsp:Transcript_29124/g.70648  ORF Transcript_29124/g.70648 Transcript_29124/m.70648 type:complete len:226 (+) Transcript_29124:1-678(+)
MQDNWDALKSEAKVVNGRLESHLAELSKVNAAFSSSDSSTVGQARLELLDSKIAVVADLRPTIEAQLSELTSLCAQLGRAATTASQRAQVTRYNAMREDLQREYKRTSENIDYHYQHARLVGKPRTSARELNSDEENLLRESKNVASSISMIDEVIGSASASRDLLSRQRTTLQGVNSKVGALTNLLPNVDELIGKIGSRKRFENVVLAITVAFCVSFCVVWKLF